ncbi:hypothetical protein FQZ97_1226610 [compost metagenome]
MGGQLINSLCQLHWDMSRDDPGVVWASHDGLLLCYEVQRIAIHYDGALCYYRAEPQRPDVFFGRLPAFGRTWKPLCK